MLTWTYHCSDKETAAALARTIAELIRGAAVRWEGLPGWQTHFHVTCKMVRGSPQVGLLIWPEPDTE